MSQPIASVVIPAYNEGAVIGRALAALTSERLDGPLEIVVSANGCTDSTVQQARSFAGVRVLDRPQPGKTGALNAGDACATAFPRVYLDADVELSPGALRALIAALQGPEPLVGAPSVRFDTTASSSAVRAYYSVFARLPYVTRGLIGLGVYALSAAGRSRFGAFPDVLGDDLFVERHFAPGERVTSAGTFTVHAPRDLRSLLAVRTRVARGNAELADTFPETTSSTTAAVRELVRERPGSAPAAAVFCAVSAGARLRSRRARGGPSWERDESSRTLRSASVPAGRVRP